MVYGLWIGFGIVAAGTFFGERAFVWPWRYQIWKKEMLTAPAVGTWFAFKYLFRRKAEKLERTNINYGALARLTRDGSFWVSKPG